MRLVEEDADEHDREIEEISYDDAIKIWTQVMRKAVEDYRLGMNGGGSDREAFEDAKRWFLSESDEFQSFLFVCDTLGLNPGMIRRTIFGDDV